MKLTSTVVDVELIKDPAELRDARIVTVLLVVVAEHVSLVAVEGLWLAVAFQIRTGRFEIAD